MAEPTNPATGVTPSAALSVEQRVQAFLQRQEQDDAPDETPEPQPEPEAKPANAEAKPSDAPELTPEDLPDETVTTQPSEDAFEIVHNGTQHKLSREDTIKLAQQGFDYTQKTQQVAEKAKALDVALQRAAEMEQIMPALAQEQAQVTAIKAQLDQFKDVDWVRLATEQPLEYPKFRAQYDLLAQGYNQSVNLLNQAFGEVQRRQKEITATMLQQEGQKLLDFIPEWRDPAKYKAGAQEVNDYLLAEGVPAEQIAGLSSAVAVKIARKALLYDKLLKSKGEKSKLLQTAPPVARPGVNASRDTAKADKEMDLRGRLKKTGDVKDAAALLLARMK